MAHMSYPQFTLFLVLRDSQGKKSLITCDLEEAFGPQFIYIAEAKHITPQAKLHHITSLKGNQRLIYSNHASGEIT